jgi:pyruvate formate lyase activating enzyme
LIQNSKFKFIPLGKIQGIRLLREQNINFDNMLLGGLQKLTLIDYPGKVATTVFTVGCNFRCPFCHNPELVFPDFGGATGSFSENDFFNFLKKRQGKLEGVCITGGEPTIQKDLLAFMAKIKKMNYLVKLDTNGSRPDVLKQALDKNLVDFVAMDIKNCLDKYSRTNGVETDLDRIKLSVELIKNSRKKYEFRTTVVPSLHTEEDFDKIGIWLKGAENYALQEFRNEGKVLDEKFGDKIKNKTSLNLEEIRKNLEKKKYFKKIIIK